VQGELFNIERDVFAVRFEEAASELESLLPVADSYALEQAVKRDRSVRQSTGQGQDRLLAIIQGHLFDNCRVKLCGER
jgi:hypothetical protein